MRVYIGPYPGPRSRKERKVSVRIDPHDAWSAYENLARIIHPLLIEVSKDKQGSPHVHDEDVPEELRSTSAPPKENEWDIDDNWHGRWEWVMGEMIWAFGEILTDWEHQFHSGEIDREFIPADVNPETGEVLTYEWVKTDKDTSEFDVEGYKAHQDRIVRGTTLFGKYFMGLWT